MADTEKPWQFQPGNTFGRGRPKGARSKLGEDFLQALYADWTAHGAPVIETIRKERPHEYLKLIASLLPRQVEVAAEPFGEVSDDELRAMIDLLRGQLATVVTH